MGKLNTAISTSQALILGVVVVGCSTAAVVTGHISGSEFMTAVGIVLGAGGAVTAAHVGGSVAVKSSQQSQPPTVTQASPQPPSELAVPQTTGTTTQPLRTV